MGLVFSAYLYEGVNRETTIVFTRFTPSNADGEKLPWNVMERLVFPYRYNKDRIFLLEV